MESMKKDKMFVFLRRLRFFSLALANIYIKSKYPGKSASDLLSSSAEFKKMFDEFWMSSIRELNDAHYQATETDKITGFALVRSERRWKAVKEKFAAIFEIDNVMRQRLTHRRASKTLRMSARPRSRAATLGPSIGHGATRLAMTPYRSRHHQCGLN